MTNTADSCYHCGQLFRRQTIQTEWGGAVRLGLCRCDYLQCRACSATVPPTAKACTQCGTSLPEWPRKRA